MFPVWDLDGNVAVKVLVVGLVNDAKGTNSQLAGDSIPAQKGWSSRPDGAPRCQINGIDDGIASRHNGACCCGMSAAEDGIAFGRLASGIRGIQLAREYLSHNIGMLGEAREILVEVDCFSCLSAVEKLDLQQGPEQLAQFSWMRGEGKIVLNPRPCSCTPIASEATTRFDDPLR
jgi:hypothetical protein